MFCVYWSIHLYFKISTFIGTITKVKSVPAPFIKKLARFSRLIVICTSTGTHPTMRRAKSPKTCCVFGVANGDRHGQHSRGPSLGPAAPTRDDIAKFLSPDVCVTCLTVKAACLVLPLVIVTVSHRPVSPDACVTCLTVKAACLVLQEVIVTVSHRPVSPDACVTCLTVKAACLVLQEVIVTVKTQACDN